ncbi:MAG: DUF6807 family protein [Planctomycetota bacterium]|nr:DUF6807 family protein [Planctomycetota bacterium]
MRKFLCLLTVALSTSLCYGEPLQIIIDDPDGSAAITGSPKSTTVDLKDLKDVSVSNAGMQLTEVTAGVSDAKPIPAQFEPQSKGGTRGKLWWLMPPGPKGKRVFRLDIAKTPATEKMTASFDAKTKYVDVSDGGKPVFRYNQGTVPPPPEIVERFEKKHNPPWYYARGDYIHPVYGPDGEQLTDDYSINHPHHRGCFWSWPVLRWNDEVRDIWAVRVKKDQPGGAWARPVAMRRVQSGPVMALIDAENVWKWGDKDQIVREEVVIRTFRASEKTRLIDITVTLTALVDGVSIGGRPGPGYGGFTFRTFPKFDQRKIDLRIDPTGADPQVAWFHLTGNFPGGKGPAGVAVLQHAENRDYPHCPDAAKVDGVAKKYPPWRTITTGFPGNREVALPKGKPLVLKYRLWIHPGLSDEQTLNNLWRAYQQE